MVNNFAKKIGEGFKDKNKLTTQVSRYLMKETKSDRRTDCIHPSEMAKENWCPRSTFYQIAGYPTDPIPRSLMMEMVFETGHDAHRKWQQWFREMGVLEGLWRCLACGNTWDAVSPDICPACDAPAYLINYEEVPIFNDEYLIAGKADGIVHRPDGSKTLIEIKTIGVGTVRWDAPNLVYANTFSHKDEDGKLHQGIDWQGVWNNIRRPFNAHLRQGMIYCLSSGINEITFIYDPKFLTAHPKEFLVKFNPEVIEESLEKCLIVKSSLEKNRPPKRPMWAEPDNKTCKACAFKKECYERRTERDNLPKTDVGKDGFEEAKPVAPKKARIRFTETSS